MKDRELLEVAANAAEFIYSNARPKHGLLGCFKTDSEQTSYLWNPLADDGDALRLAVSLKLTELWFTDGGGPAEVVVGRKGTDVLVTERLADDPYKATRRAIVRAAVEIGKAMK